MSGRTVAGAALSVLAAAPARGYTVNEIVAILREREMSPNRAYYHAVYQGLMSQVRAGKVTRSRGTGGVWLWRVSESPREVASS